MPTKKRTSLPKGKKTVYCLRTVDQNGKAYGGFRWPKKGYVEAPDWSTEPECGHGLHGYLRGTGDGTQIKWDGLFQVVKVIEEELIDLIGKVKFPRCEVVLTGTRKEATDFLVKEYPGVPVIGATVVVGDCGTAMAGYNGTATVGYNGTAMAGNRGTTTAGDDGTATAGHYGTATAGHAGTATAGYSGTATAGNDGTATAGNDGTATAGGSGTATAGDGGTAMAGEKGRISLTYWDTSHSRYRQAIGYIGEDGLLANVAYKLNDHHKFVRA